MFAFYVILTPHLCLKSVYWMDEWMNQTMSRINDDSENEKNGYKVYLRECLLPDILILHHRLIILKVFFFSASLQTMQTQERTWKCYQSL